MCCWPVGAAGHRRLLARGGQLATCRCRRGNGASFTRVGSAVSPVSAGLGLAGLVDSHVHLIPGGLSLMRLDLRHATSKQAFIDAVAAATSQLAPGAWLLGGGWEESRWGGELPAAEWVDAVTPENPIWLIRMDAHMGLANRWEGLLACGCWVGPGCETSCVCGVLMMWRVLVGRHHVRVQGWSLFGCRLECAWPLSRFAS